MIPITRPLLGAAEEAAAAAVVRSGWLTQGKEVAAFEAEFAAATGAPHACAVSSATAALHLALLAAGVGPGDEVITVSHSFIATANTIRQTGAVPVFADIDPATFNLNPANLAGALSPRTRAILCVHQIGMPCDLAAIGAFARHHGLALIEDAACAIGTEIRGSAGWERIGAPHGDVACFSFHPRKLITTGEGGMLTTRHAIWDAQFRLLRQHGMSVPDTVRHAARSVTFEAYPVPGYNYRLTDIQAAIGRAQLARLPDIVAERRRLAARYTALLAAVPGVVPPSEPAWARSNWQSYCVRLPSWVDQRTVMQAMLDADVATRRGIMCAHLEGAYADSPLRQPLPESEAAHHHCILLPLFPGLADAEQDQVVDALARAVTASGRAPAARQTSRPAPGAVPASASPGAAATMASA